MSETPTPRCNLQFPVLIQDGVEYVELSFAEELETELTAAREELKAVTEQRDRLAEALGKLCYMHQNHSLTVSSYEAIKQALQPLNQNDRTDAPTGCVQ